MLAAMSLFFAPWFSSGWISLLANTPQREAMVYTRSCWAARASISAVSTSRSVAIWSMKAPVPPAQEPFIRASMPPPLRKMILASSPPSSMMQSVPGT